MSQFSQGRSQSVRLPAVAGRFYPDNPVELRRMIDNFLAEGKLQQARVPKAVIAPHAGYIYSGPVAASAFAQLAPARGVVKRVVVLGPSHWVAVRGLAIPSTRTWLTPLGRISVDTEALMQVSSLPQISVMDSAHGREHALEVELPFLQVVLGEFSLVPLVVGDASDPELAEVFDRLWDGDETRFVISSDLSHYQEYARARELDAATARAIERLSAEDIGEDQACGRVPIRGLLQAARNHGLRAHTLDLRNSGDTAGPRDQVVGYGAWGLC